MAALMVAVALWDAHSALRFLRLRAARLALHHEVVALQQEVQQLQQEFVLLQQEGRSEQSLDYLFHIAREEAGLVAPHEQVLLLHSSQTAIH